MSFNDRVNMLLGACLSEFGSQVIFTDNTDQSHTLEGIYSDEYQGVDPESGFDIISSIPNLGIRVADWPKVPEEGEQIVHNGNTYRVRHPELDGEGGATIFLDKI